MNDFLVERRGLKLLVQVELLLEEALLVGAGGGQGRLEVSHVVLKRLQLPL